MMIPHTLTTRQQYEHLGPQKFNPILVALSPASKYLIYQEGELDNVIEANVRLY